MSIKIDPRGNLKELSAQLGNSEAYFSVVKNKTPEKFDYIFSFDFNYSKSLNMYIAKVERLLCDIEKVIRKVKRYSRYGNLCKELGLSNMANTNRTQVFKQEEKIIYQIRPNDSDFLKIYFNHIQRWQTILEYLKENPEEEKELYKPERLFDEGRRKVKAVA